MGAEVREGLGPDGPYHQQLRVKEITPRRGAKDARHKPQLSQRAVIAALDVKL